MTKTQTQTQKSPFANASIGIRKSGSKSSGISDKAERLAHKVKTLTGLDDLTKVIVVPFTGSALDQDFAGHRVEGHFRKNAIVLINPDNPTKFAALGTGEWDDYLRYAVGMPDVAASAVNPTEEELVKVGLA